MYAKIFDVTPTQSILGRYARTNRQGKKARRALQNLNNRGLKNSQQAADQIKEKFGLGGAFG